MAMEDEAESCGSRPVADPQAQQYPREQNQKLEVYTEVLQRLQQSNCEEAHLPGFDDELWVHFNRLPARYALDVNAERAEDVLTHKRLLKLAKGRPNEIVFEVRVVPVNPCANGCSAGPGSFSAMTGNEQGPTFGNNLEELALLKDEFAIEDGDSVVNSKLVEQQPRVMGEITFSTLDKPKLLSQLISRLSSYAEFGNLRKSKLSSSSEQPLKLTALLAEVGLNIQEAHAFSTVDGFSLDVFVVDGLVSEENVLKKDLEKGILKLQDQIVSRQQIIPPIGEQAEEQVEFFPIEIPKDGSDVWEIDTKQLSIGEKVASGTYGELFRGSYCSQEVAIKILKGHVNQEILRDFAQEIYIMRKIRHKNVVQFIGACTRPPNLCIVTEFMAKGSIYDSLHKRKGVFQLPSLLKVAIDVSKGVNYLHQNNIIHRDLKSANLLMDENEVVKVADFGVAKVMTSENGVMTAETGTYRWMAPEVIGHKNYDHKADVFSFGILVWELLTGELPYAHLTPLQAAVGVVQKDLRPTIPKHTNLKLADLLQRCWQRDPKHRPDFTEILLALRQILKEVEEEGGHGGKNKQSNGGLFSFMKSIHR